MVSDTNEEDSEDAVRDNERERHWRMVNKYDNGGEDGTKYLLNAKKWDVYN